MVFFACPVKRRTMLCRNQFKWLCASISVIGFRSSLEWEEGNLSCEAVWVCVNMFVCMFGVARVGGRGGEGVRGACSV